MKKNENLQDKLFCVTLTSLKKNFFFFLEATGSNQVEQLAEAHFHKMEMEEMEVWSKDPSDAIDVRWTSTSSNIVEFPTGLTRKC